MRVMLIESYVNKKRYAFVRKLVLVNNQSVSTLPHGTCLNIFVFPDNAMETPCITTTKKILFCREGDSQVLLESAVNS